jgi:hypothetical protein
MKGIKNIAKLVLTKGDIFLEREGVKQTYKNIQKKAFEIYQRQKNDLIDKYFNVIKPNKNLSDTEIKNIIENEDILYED